jgi:hypothetical protein
MVGNMQPDLKPHTKEWFLALRAVNPAQANHTRQILKAAGRDDVCSVCGDHPASDFRIVSGGIPAGAPTQIRLCDDCRQMRETLQGERYEMV